MRRPVHHEVELRDPAHAGGWRPVQRIWPNGATAARFASLDDALAYAGRRPGQARVIVVGPGGKREVLAGGA
jgi:hypothetical protein